jgi:hypothetical protein
MTVRRTSDFIDTLVEQAGPVRRLGPPLVRASLWVALAAFVLILIAIGDGLRPDIAARLQQPVFILSMAAALVTGLLAALASFELSLPDRSRWWILLPVPALAVWVSTLGYGCLTDWVDIGPNGLQIGEAVRCFATLLLTSVPLSVAILVMLRYAARLRSTEVSLMSGIAVASMTTFALSLVHDLDASVMILVWNLGVALLIAGLASLFGQSLFSWMASRLPPPNESKPRP